MIGVSIDALFSPHLERGPGTTSVDAMLPAIAAAHTELMRRRGEDIGFYDLPAGPGVAQLVDELNTEVRRLHSVADHLLVLGIGGSSLGGQTLVQGLAPPVAAQPTVHFVDNVDPETLGRLLEQLDPARTAACVITKSGGTVETLAQLLIIRRWLRNSLGGEGRTRFVFVTDPDKGLLRELAAAEGIRSFSVPGNVGGRFSALTPVGLLPAAFAGVDIAKVLSGAAQMVERVCSDDMQNNPAARLALGTLLAERELGSRSLIMMPYSDSLRVFSDWFVQLWAESLGKRCDRSGAVVEVGQTPIPAVGATDQHAQVQLFVEGPKDKLVVLVNVEATRALPIPDELADRPEVSFLHGHGLGDLLAAERRATRAAMLDAGVPVLDITVPQMGPEAMGELLVLCEAATATRGIAMNINPFDQPGVEAGKRMALGIMGRAGYEEEAQRVLARESRGQ